MTPYSCLGAIFIYYTIFLGVYFPEVSGQCVEEHKSLLLQLKTNLEFDPFGKLGGWNENVDCCVWSGVTCDVSGLVTGLDLNNQLLSTKTGNWSSLLRLQNLETLNLSHNSFNSSIPAGLDQLSNLKVLNFSESGFKGQIPIEISCLTTLVSLDLSIKNYFYDIPLLQLQNPNLADLVGNLTEVVELYLDGVNISAAGNEWSHALSSSLPKLRVLSLSDCGLYGEFPKRIFQVSSLQTIDLSNNYELKGSLPEFPHNSSLQTLKISWTDLSGILPDSIGNLKMLSTIELNGCNFSGSIPKSMENLTQLVYLDFSFNRFTGTIPSFRMSKNLTTINLSKNRLFGGIPRRWEGLSNLMSLDLSNNTLNGSIPESIFSLPSLQEIYLYGNRFSGQLTIRNATSSHLLGTLDLSNNALNGSIPESLFSLPSLWVIYLHDNQFSGQLIVPNVSSSHMLDTLDLSNNALNGSIPESLFSLPSLRVIYLHDNQFSGQLIVPNVSSSHLLGTLDLSNNTLNGSIPEFLFSLPSLLKIHLSNNQFSGPLTVSNVSSHLLEILDVSSNKLGGPD